MASAKIPRERQKRGNGEARPRESDRRVLAEASHSSGGCYVQRARIHKRQTKGLAEEDKRMGSRDRANRRSRDVGVAEWGHVIWRFINRG